MATSKQYKAIGEDLWKGRTEKVVSQSPTVARRPNFDQTNVTTER